VRREGQPTQNVTPNFATNVRGCRKCVPLNVDRKLYSATTLVKLSMASDAVRLALLRASVLAFSQIT